MPWSHISDIVTNTEKHMCMLMYSDSLLDTQICMIQFQRTTTDDRGEEERGKMSVWSYWMELIHDSNNNYKYSLPYTQAILGTCTVMKCSLHC